MTPPSEFLLECQEKLARVEPVLTAFAQRVPKLVGGRWRVIRGATTDAEQALLYAKGRTIPGVACTPGRPLGSTVTEAKTASETAHGLRQFGACAVDLVAMNDDGTCDWSPPRYLVLGRVAKEMGFEWGGDFMVKRGGVMVAMHDNGHIQVPGWRSIPLRSNTEAGDV
jgi:hypothetical protein